MESNPFILAASKASAKIEIELGNTRQRELGRLLSCGIELFRKRGVTGLPGNVDSTISWAVF